jgi:hypothetical protein
MVVKMIERLLDIRLSSTFGFPINGRQWTRVQPSDLWARPEDLGLHQDRAVVT